MQIKSLARFVRYQIAHDIQSYVELLFWFAVVRTRKDTMVKKRNGTRKWNSKKGEKCFKLY